MDESSVVISLKPPKKAPTRPQKNGTALVPFKQIGDAFAVVCASGRADRGLAGVKVSWAEGKEPPILGWLKKQGKLDPAPKTQSKTKTEDDQAHSGDARDHAKDLFEGLSQKPASASFSSFSSFPDSFVSNVLLSHHRTRITLMILISLQRQISNRRNPQSPLPLRPTTSH